MTSVAILCPVLNRPSRVAPLIANVASTTHSPYRLLFVVCEDDEEELRELRACRADHLVVDPERISWACKINDGLRAVEAEWCLTGADDLRFHDGWFERALTWASDSTQVVGTNDICNPRVMTGEHSTHTLFRRSYALELGTIDEKGKAIHEGYRHDFADDEFVATAKARGVYAHAFDSIVEHLHPNVGKAQDDATYRAGRKWSADGRRLFTKRKALWAVPEAVRMSMVPTPDRAVVVTASYGNYDPNIRVPVEQDMPVTFVCVTDNPELQVPEPWRVVVQAPRFPDNPRLSAKVPKMLPDVGCDDVVWIDASMEIVSSSFVREALASRHDGIAAYKHPRRDDPYQEIEALLGPENQNGLYFHRPLKAQAESYRQNGHPPHSGLYACGTLAWDLRDPKARELGEAWLAETQKWSHQDQVEFPVVCRRLGISPGTFPLPQLEPRAMRNQRGPRTQGNRWLRIHPHIVKLPPFPVSVLIPFGSQDEHRRAAYAFVLHHYEAKGWEVCVGAPDGAWSKGAALADAFDQATHDILVIADADCICDDASLDEAIRHVIDGAPWVVPHRKVWRMDLHATRRVLAGGPLRPAGPTHQAVVGGGIVVCSREAWEKSGGIDPRFVKWGGEDLSWAVALKTLVGEPILGAGKLFHLYHPLEPRKESRPEGHQNSMLHSRYRDASGDKAAMRKLIKRKAKVSA